MNNTTNQGNNKFSSKELTIMQRWDLDKKISVSLAKIAEFYTVFPHKIYILFNFYSSYILKYFCVKIWYLLNCVLFVCG